MKTSSLTKKYTFLLSLLLFPLCVSTFAAIPEGQAIEPVTHGMNPQVEQKGNAPNVNEIVYEQPVVKNVNQAKPEVSGHPATTQKAEPPKKTVISNAVSWTILLTFSAAVYWTLTYRKSAWKNSFYVRPMTGWFRGVFIGLAHASNKLFLYPANFHNKYFSIPVTVLILISPLCLSWMYHYIKIGLSSEGFHQWLEEAVPGLEGYIKALFAHKTNEGEPNNHLEYFLATLASFSIGTLFFFRPLISALVIYDAYVNGYYLNATESLICGLLGIVFIPILFYLPTFMIGMPLGALINRFRGVNNQPAAAPINNKPDVTLATPAPGMVAA